jgi:apolipoprotein N-acyltransferase
MLEFTGQGEVPDLVVWPESAIPDLLNYADDKLAQISDAARGAPVIVGVNRREGQRYYNSLVLLGRGGVVERLYDKQHLVPFGEYIPGGELIGDVGLGNFGASTGGGFSSGTTSRIMDVPGIGAIRPLICYEGIFANEIGADTRPRTMILITNDAWNGKDAGPLQHLAQARLRAIEQGMPMVRVANTGVSALIDAQGRLHGTIGMDTAGYLDLPLPPLALPTVYSLSGDWPFYTLLFLSLAAFLGFKRRETL